jgi:hypothetical protein
MESEQLGRRTFELSKESARLQLPPLPRGLSKCTALAATVAAEIALTSCGFNSIRLARASEVSQAGTAAVTKARDFMQQVATARNEANISLVASDEGCSWAQTIVLRGDKRPPGSSICMPLGTQPDLNYGDLEISLEPIPDAQLKPTLDSIAALASYLQAVNTITARKDPDVSGDLADAYGKAVEAQSDLAALAGSKAKLIPQLSDQQKAAIKGLIDIIVQMSSEQQKVRDLSKLVQAQNANVVSVIENLKASLDSWATGSLTGDLQMTDADFTRMGRQLGKQPPVYKGYDARRAVIERAIASHKAVAAIPGVTNAIKKSLDAVEEAQKDLVDGLSAHPHWTAKERAEAAAINRARLLAALHAIAAAAAAF